MSTEKVAKGSSTLFFLHTALPFDKKGGQGINTSLLMQYVSSKRNRGIFLISDKLECKSQSFRKLQLQ